MLNNDRLLVQILLLGLLAACLWVLAPFASALFWAAVLAFASWPVMRVLTRWLNGNATLAAGLLTFSWMVLVAVPLVWLGFNIADQIRDANALLHDLQVEGLPPAPAWLGEVPLIGDALLNFWSTVDEQGTALIASIRPYIGQVANWLLAGADGDAVDVNRAGTALGDAATEFGAGHVEIFADNPQDRRRRVGIDLPGLTVDVQLDHGIPTRF